MSSRSTARDVRAGRVSLRRILTLLIISLIAAGAAPVQADQSKQAKVPDTIEQRVLACAICHGDQGEGLRGNEYYPRLAGKPARYLFNQMVNFRDHRRRYEMMSYIVRYLSDDYLREMAVYYSQLSPPYPPPKNAPRELLTRGEALVAKGDPSRKIPACAACHGNKLTGMEPAIPGLVGLNLEYVSAQMGAWKTGRRKAHAPDCMGQIASLLTVSDISAVSAWLAAQSASPDTPPAPANSFKLPMKCGGVQ